ncbi:MAG TPA: penicillin acylase family protein [Vicinamibacterales bacterium]|nr:penicillin acylase family protein [Vicinamibacterales bacterium]
MPLTTVRPLRRRRWPGPLLVLTAAALILAAALAWWVAGRTVPPTSGERRAPGLQAPVEVLFDRWGVPHVYARSREDAWFAVGYLQARDRLWQMELYRRAASGRLSELFGERTLAADRRFRLLGLRKAAARELADTTPQARLALERFASGVNAAMSSLGRWERPIEFQLLRTEPEPWSPLDSLAVGKLMAWRLAENRHGELVRGALARRFGSAAADSLLNAWPSDAPAVLDSARSTARQPHVPLSLPRGDVPIADSSRQMDLPPGLEWLASGTPPGGSNSWVVAGNRTATRRPLLANDPHLGIELPSVWYDAHLVAADLDVAGAMLPGSPFIVIGHNSRIAWGITNTGVDVQDFYIEDVDFRRRRYLYRGIWEPLTIEPVVIDVRGRSHPERYDIFITRHGPLYATEAEWDDPPLFDEDTPRGDPRPLALRWDSLTEGQMVAGFEALNRAANWSDFLNAVRSVTGVSLSFVYADATGNIGFAMSGALPIRANGNGALPVPGWGGGYEWTGTVPPEQLPASLNPPSGQIVTANAEIDRSWPTAMTRDWRAPFRAARITALLENRTGLDIDAFREIQGDVWSEGADRLLAAVEGTLRTAAGRSAEPEARTALARLRLWDRRVDDRPVVTLFHAFERALWRRAFADEMGPELFNRFFEYGLSERFAGLYAILPHREARWWDDIGTIDKRETRDDIVVLAAADAMRALRQKFGDETDWTWGRIHAAHFRHPLGGGFLLRWIFDRGPVPVVGNSSTVNKAAVNPRKPYAVDDIASYRQIIDVGAWDRTRAVLTTGQSGHVRSPHYFDQNALWAAVQDRPFPFSRRAVDEARTSRLLLVPGPAN